MSFAKNRADYFNLEHIGWKYYNTIKKKAVEQEFSWSGLLISLSIAFFIVAISAIMFKFILLSAEQSSRRPLNRNVYYLENASGADLAIKQNYINIS